MNRESFKSRLGFLLVSAGCAIGIGNVWKFPYVAGQNGGGIFVLFYLLFLAVVGIPVLTMELAVGRASRKSTVEAYKMLENRGQKWHIHGWVGILGCFLLMMYYTVVSGWMLGYFVKFASGRFDGISADENAAVFNSMLENPVEMILWLGVTVAVGFSVCGLGLQKGIERITKFMMLGMFGILILLVVYCLTLEGAAEGIRFYLLPDLSGAFESGFGNVMTAAMNQAFFTLGIGLASMEIFGSYMPKENTLISESVRICVLDTLVAVMSGLIVFPACCSFGVEPDAGPPLIFETLPKVFANMAGGRVWGSLFFLFMTFASISTVIAVFENLTASCMESFGLKRKNAVIILAFLMFFASIPSVLGYNIFKEFTPVGGRNILDSEDFVVSNLLLPSGALVYLLFCVTKWGWGFDEYIKEVNTGKGIKLSPKFKPYFQYVLPVLILVILFSGITG